VTGPEVLVFDVIGLPGAQGSKRHVGGGRMIESSKRVAPWRQDVASAAVLAHRKTLHWPHPMDGPLWLEVRFRFPVTSSWRKADRVRGWRWKDRTPDIDKLLRSTCDALTTAGAIADDARIVHVDASMVETAGWSGAEIHVRQVGYP
jgi:crossover junction endodeoxyribonuclease RusA